MNASNDNSLGFDLVTMTLDGSNGNAFHLLGEFAAQARQQGWSVDAIANVQREAMAGDYSHLIRTIREHTSDGG